MRGGGVATCWTIEEVVGGGGGGRFFMCVHRSRGMGAWPSPPEISWKRKRA